MADHQQQQQQQQQQDQIPSLFNDEGQTDLERMHAIENTVDLCNFGELTPTERLRLAKERSDRLLKFYHERSERFCGFQINVAEKYADRLAPLLDIHLNNIGDPYADVGGFRMNSKAANVLCCITPSCGSVQKRPTMNHNLPVLVRLPMVRMR
jgi:hypothetical protein